MPIRTSAKRRLRCQTTSAAEDAASRKPSHRRHRVDRQRLAGMRRNLAGQPGMAGQNEDRRGEDPGIAGEGAVVKPVGHHPGQRHGRGHDRVEDRLGRRHVKRLPDRRGRAEQPQQDRAAHDGDDRHRQRRRQPVPDLQVQALGDLRSAAEHRLGDEEHARLGQERHHADEQDEEAEKRRRRPHPESRVMGMGRVVVALGPEEGMDDEAEGIGSRKQRPHRGQSRYQPGHAEQRGVRGLLQHHLLGQEPVEERDAGHRQAGDQGDAEGDRHQSPQPAQLADIAGMGLVVDDSRGHEERRLEGGVVEDMENRRHCGIGAPRPQEEGDQPQMRHGGEGQQRLQIVLEERHGGADHHGDQADRGHDPEPFRRAGQNRPHPRHQEDPGLHHGGRVQVGRYRRGRGHGVRQPEVERELRRLGEATQEDQDQRRQVERRGLDRLAVFQDHRQVVAAHDPAEEQHAADHRQATHAGDRQSHARSLSAFGQVLPVADQQEGRQRGQLPEDQKHQYVVRQDDPHHRALEQQQIGEELPHVVVTREVIAAVDDDQAADSEDQRGEEESQPVEHQRHVEAEFRQPFETGSGPVSRHQGRQVAEKARQRDDADPEGRQRADAPTSAVHDAGNQGPDEREKHDEKERHGSPARPDLMP